MATLRQVEKITASFGTGDSSKSVTLGTTLLDTTKAFLIFSVRNAANTPNAGHMRGKISNTTTIVFTRPGTGFTAEVVGYVVEFTAGIIVERGTDTSESFGVTLTSITDLSDAFILSSASTVGSTFGSDDFWGLFLFDDGDKKISMNTAGTPATVVIDWQVIQLDNVDVQRGTVAMAAVASVTDSITAVDLAKSFLVFFHEDDQTVPDRYMIRGRFTSTTELTFDKVDGTSGDANIRWEVVEFTDDTTVQEVLSNFIATDGQNDETINAVSALTKAAAFASDQFILGQSCGKTEYSADDITGESAFTFDLTTTTNLQLKRESTNAVSDVAGYVIDFGAGAPPTINLVMAPYIPA